MKNPDRKPIMLPPELVRRLESQKYIDSGKLAEALSGPAPVSIRINKEKWDHIPSGAKPVPWCRDGFYLEERPSYTADPLFHSGCYYPQEASGMFIGQVFRQMEGASGFRYVLDLCGAPGGKATHLASLIGKNGLLVANEVIRPRASVLAENITRWGTSNTMVTRNDPAEFAGLPGFFDLILVDAPCSGEGMFHNPVAVKEWSPENAQLCRERQKRILMDIWPSLKEDGIMIYSTCTFNPGENEMMIKWLVEKQEAVSLRLDISQFKGIVEINFQGISGYGFYPGEIKGEGLFISVLKKTKRQDPLRLKIKKRNDIKLTGDERAVAEEWTTFPPENIVRFKDRVAALPGRFGETSHLLNTLRVIKAGTVIYTVRNRNYIPSHELAVSQYIKNGSFNSIDVDHDKALSFLKRENLSAAGAQKGWNIIRYKGINLGFVNNIGYRMNNYYPADRRIKMEVSASDKDKILRWNK